MAIRSLRRRRLQFISHGEGVDSQRSRSNVDLRFDSIDSRFDSFILLYIIATRISLRNGKDHEIPRSSHRFHGKRASLDGLSLNPCHDGNTLQGLVSLVARAEVVQDQTLGPALLGEVAGHLWS